MLLVPIHRQNSLPIEGTPPVDFTLHSHPYHDFPTIVSHVHPRFVLCNAGPKILQDYDVWKEQGVRKEDMPKVSDIWLAWSKTVDRVKPNGKAFFLNPRNDDPDAGDDDSVHTTSHRVTRNSTKRKFPEQQGSPTPAPKSSKHQKLADDGTWIDDETLREFDQQSSTHVGEMKSKKQLILDWLNGVSTTGVKENVKGNKNTLDEFMTFPGAFLEHF
jgi:hypothetical protein